MPIFRYILFSGTPYKLIAHNDYFLNFKRSNFSLGQLNLQAFTKEDRVREIKRNFNYFGAFHLPNLDILYSLFAMTCVFYREYLIFLRRKTERASVISNIGLVETVF